MDPTALVIDHERIEEGENLIKKLSEEGFEVSAAFWILTTHDEQWHFYVVAPAVDNEGRAKAYSQVYAVARQLPPLMWLDPLTIKLIGPSSPIAQDVLNIYTRAPGAKGQAIRWRGRRLADISIEEAYLYPLPAM